MWILAESGKLLNLDQSQGVYVTADGGKVYVEFAEGGVVLCSCKDTEHGELIIRKLAARLSTIAPDYYRPMGLCPWCGQLFQKPHGRTEYCPNMPCRNNYASHKKRNTDAVLGGHMTLEKALARFNSHVAVPATMEDFTRWVEEKK